MTALANPWGLDLQVGHADVSHSQIWAFAYYIREGVSETVPGIVREMS